MTLCSFIKLRNSSQSSSSQPDFFLLTDTSVSRGRRHPPPHREMMKRMCVHRDITVWRVLVSLRSVLWERTVTLRCWRLLMNVSTVQLVCCKLSPLHIWHFRCYLPCIAGILVLSPLAPATCVLLLPDIDRQFFWENKQNMVLNLIENYYIFSRSSTEG